MHDAPSHADHPPPGILLDDLVWPDKPFVSLEAHHSTQPKVGGHGQGPPHPEDRALYFVAEFIPSNLPQVQAARLDVRFVDALAMLAAGDPQLLDGARVYLKILAQCPAGSPTIIKCRPTWPPEHLMNSQKTD